jgi:hypothetical protein
MSIQHLFRRITLAFGMLLAATSAAHAQPGLPESPSEQEFVPGIEDLQLFEQPDFSSYGRGPQPPQGWFGSAEYLNWTVGTAPKTPIGNAAIGSQNVWGFQGRTVNTGNLTLTLITVTINPPAPGVVTTTVVAGTFPSNPALVGPIPVGSSTNYVPGTLIDPVLQNNALDTSVFQSDFTSGGRFEFGRMNGDRGWLVSSFNLGTQTQSTSTTDVSINFANTPVGFVDTQGPNIVPGPGTFGNTAFQGDGYDDDLDGDGVYGRNGRDRGTQAGAVFNPPADGIPDRENPGSLDIPIDWDDAVRLPTVYSNLHVENKTGVYGVEAMRLWRLDWSPRGGVWELFGGLRYLDIDDTFSVTGTVDNLNPIYAMNPLGDTRFSTNAVNHILGGQVGARWSKQTDRWQMSIETRFFAAANFQNVRQSGTFGSNNNTVVPTDDGTGTGTFVTPAFVPFRDEVVNMQLPHTFSSSFNGTTFTPAGELRFNLKYQVFRKVYLQLGYTALYAGGIARASNMVVYRLPGLGINSANNDSGLFMNGVNFGIVINR